MHAHILVAHPEPKSFNAQLASISQESLKTQNWTTSFTDLYSSDFDPREGASHFSLRKDKDVFHTQTEQRHSADNNRLPEEVESEVQNLMNCDLLVVHFPVWWFGMPAILKGWMDRVFAYGRMYTSTKRYDKGVCAGKKMIACVTTGATADSCSFNGKEGDIQLHLWPMLFPFRYIGFDVLQPEVFHGVGGVAFIENQEGGLSTLEVYSNHWVKTLSTLKERESIQYNRDEEFDERKQLVSGAPVYSPFVRQNQDI